MTEFDIHSYPDLKDKTILLTGATSGIGLEPARLLSQTPCTLILHGRNPAKLARVEAELRASGGPATIKSEIADLSLMSNVRGLARRVRENYSGLKLLINNAALSQRKAEMTADGLEMTFAVNHLAPMLLAMELSPVLRSNAPSRIVFLGSMGHRFGIVNRRQIQSWMMPWGIIRYCCSKTLVMAAARKLGKLLDQSGVSVLSVHPGSIPTTDVFNVPLLRPFSLNVKDGAEAVVNAALAPKLQDAHGAYFNRFKLEKPGFQVRDPRFAEFVWRESLEYLGISEQAALNLVLGGN